MIEFMPPIAGRKVSIRQPNESDLDAWYDLETDRDVKRYAGGPSRYSRDEWIEGMKKRLNNSQDSTLPLIVTYKSTGEFVGRAALFPVEGEGQPREIQVLISKQYWRQGLGRETCELLVDAAFNRIGASSVVAIVHPQNEASLSLFRGLDFKCTGTKQSNRWDHEHLKLERKLGPS